MTLDWLVSCTLWIGLFLLLASALMKKSSLAAAGWAIFAFFWLSQPAHYLAIEDYFNVALALAVALLCFCMAWRALQKEFYSSASAWASYAAAVCGILYFPFAKIEPLRDGLIGFTTQSTAETLRIFSIPVAMEGWNVMALNGRSVEIILACTAIESMALFAGVILSVEAPAVRRIAALATSISTIYVLNIVRNSFVLMAYGYSWFGSDSFNIAHNVIAKAGSTLALLAISYLVFLLLPELLLEIDELAAELRHPGGEAA